MAKFPVNFAPNVGYIWKTEGADAYRIECVQCLMRHPLALRGRKSEWGAYLTVDATLQGEGEDPIPHSVSGTTGQIQFPLLTVR